MVYKPEFRVGIDWDGDGYIHTEGVLESTPPNKIEDALYTQAHSHGWTDYIEDLKTVTTLVNDAKASSEVQIPIGRDYSRFYGFMSSDIQKVGEAGLPDSLFDGYGLTDVASNLYGGTNRTTQTEDLIETDIPEQFDETNVDTYLHINEPVITEWSGYSLSDSDGYSGNLFDGNSASYWVANRGGRRRVCAIRVCFSRRMQLYVHADG